MKVGDLVKTIYRDEFAVVTAVWQYSAGVLGAVFVYPSDGYYASQPQTHIKEVITA